MDIIDLINRTSFLGPEFLTWLWYRSELQSGVFEGGGEVGPFELWFDDRLTVAAPTVNAQENLFKGGHPASSLEARTALRLGKMADEAKLRIVRASQDWGFVLRADLTTASVKALIEQLDVMLKALLRQFLVLRTSPEWEQSELPSLRIWVETGGESA